MLVIPAAQHPLSGRLILVVEDDWFNAVVIAETLEDAGAKIIGPSPSWQAAMVELQMHRPDVATLDINLGDETSFELASYLRDHQIPFMFVTGCVENIPAKFADVDILEKPLGQQALVVAVAKLINSSRPCENSEAIGARNEID